MPRNRRLPHPFGCWLVSAPRTQDRPGAAWPPDREETFSCIPPYFGDIDPGIPRTCAVALQYSIPSRFTRIDTSRELQPGNKHSVDKGEAALDCQTECR